jgi:hypothetical protein
MWERFYSFLHWQERVEDAFVVIMPEGYGVGFGFGIGFG